jgi:hypothetical protein
MKQTAVEWLGKELESYGDPQFCEIEWEQLDSLIQQAKEMEKEQIIDAFVECWKENMPNGYECKQSAEYYYNETFKQLTL